MDESWSLSEWKMGMIEIDGSEKSGSGTIVRDAIPFCALAQGRSTLIAPKITDHVEARLWLASKILRAGTEVMGNRITIHGIGYGS